MAIGQVDEGLSAELKRQLIRTLDEKWNPEVDDGVNVQLHDQYKGELYGLLCSVIQVEAETLVEEFWIPDMVMTGLGRSWS